MRTSNLGCRGYIIYDEGLLDICLQMREDGVLPRNTTFKISALFSVANPSALKFWADYLNPTDSINPARNLAVSTLAAMRTVAEQPLDVHAYWRTSVVRTKDAAEIVRTSSPVYFKNARSGTHAGNGITAHDQVKQSGRLVEAIKRDCKGAEQATLGETAFGVPVEPEK